MWKRENLLFGFAAIGAIAALLKILEYFGIGPNHGFASSTNGVAVPLVHSLSGLIWAIALFTFSIVLSVVGFLTANRRRKNLESQLQEFDRTISELSATQLPNGHEPIRKGALDELLTERAQLIRDLSSTRGQLDQARRESDTSQEALKKMKDEYEPEQTSMDIALNGRRDAKGTIEGLTNQVSDLKLRLQKDLDHYKELWAAELEAKLRVQRTFAFARVQWAGFDKVPRYLTVAVQFVFPDPDDIALARHITEFFNNPLIDNSPWKTETVEQVKWFPNHTGTRIVMVSDLELASRIKDSFNEHNILGERVGLTGSPSGQPPPEPSADFRPEIRIVIFPKEKEKKQ